MPSRRRVLASIGTAAVAGFAGCSSFDSDGTATTDCRGHALEHGGGDVLDAGVMATVEDGDVRLAVPLSVETVDRQNVDRIRMHDASGEIAHVIPVSPEDADLMANRPGVGDGQLRYEQYVGHRPFHGQYRLVAVDRDGTAVDSITVEFNCFPDAED